MAVSLYYTKTTQYVYPAYQDFVVSAAGLTTYFFDVATNSWTTTINPKFLLKIIINGSEVAFLKTPPARSERVRFHIQTILQDYLDTDIRSAYVDSDTNPVSIHKTQGFAKNESTLIKVELQAGEEYTIGENFYSFFYQQFAAGSVNTDFFVFNGVAQNETGENFNLDPYKLDVDGKFLTEYNVTNTQSQIDTETYHNKIRIGDYHTIALFYGDWISFTSEAYDIRIVLYDADISLITSANVSNTFADSPIQSNGMTNDKGIMWFGSGVQNLIDAGTFTLANFNSATYYSLAARNSSAQTMSIHHWYKIMHDDCKDFDTIRLGYVNSLGAWDYYNFTKRSTKTSTSKRTTYQKDHGYNQSSNLNAWDYLPSQGGSQVFNNTVTEEIEANTDWVTEEQAVIFKSLFTSPKVHMQLADNTWVPVVISEKAYTKQTSANDKIIQYVLTIQKSHNYIVQRG